ncbi:hypothetical protein [Bacillus sp. FSL K6-0067]
MASNRNPREDFGVGGRIDHRDCTIIRADNGYTLDFAYAVNIVCVKMRE